MAQMRPSVEEVLCSPARCTSVNKEDIENADGQFFTLPNLQFGVSRFNLTRSVSGTSCGGGPSPATSKLGQISDLQLQPPLRVLPLMRILYQRV